jgi:dipeptidyl aminopeptidase/acylaminoacyl peptidase
MPRPPQPLRTLDIDTLWQFERIGAVALSPDGRHAVCSVTQPDMAANTSATSLWRLATDGAAPRRLTSCGDKDGAPAWSPRGDRIAFVARRRWNGQVDATPQLYVLPADGGEAERVGDFAPGVESFKWLPDGSGIVFTAWVWPGVRGAAAQAQAHRAFGERKTSGYATSEAYHRYWDHHVPEGRVLHLWLQRLRGGADRTPGRSAQGRCIDLFEGLGDRAVELPRDAAGNDVFDISPDGRRIAFVHDPAREPRLGNRLRLSEIDLGTREVRALIDEPGWDIGAPRYAPDGDAIAITAAHVARHHHAFAEPALWTRDGRWRLLAPGWDHAVDAPLRWTADGQALVFAAEERGRRHLWRLPRAGGQPQRAWTGGWVQAFDVASASDTVVVAADGASHPVRVHAWQGDAAPRRIEAFNDDRLRGVALGEVRELTLPGAGGAPVQTWLVFPPGFDATRRHAVTHVIHGGPFAAAGDTFGYRWNPHVLAAATGHVIAMVNYHGSSGFGEAFASSLVGRQGQLELQDIEAATDWLRRQPWADPARFAAAGGSYGGFLVAWMNGHAPAGRYQAYVCHAGVFDRVVTFSADSYPQRPQDLGAFYWADMRKVLAQSPHAAAGRMHTATLVIHGALDYRVPDANGLAYYNTLQARGVEARLLWFPDENHWVLKPRNSRQWYGEVVAWLRRFGADAAPSGDAAAPAASAAAQP